LKFVKNVLFINSTKPTKLFDKTRTKMLEESALRGPGE